MRFKESNALKTHHAPASRASHSMVQNQAHRFASDSFLRQILDAVPTLLTVLNGQRQIIFSNRALLDYLGAGDAQAGQGLRPGELFGCVNANAMAAGCGTAESCRTCGAVNAILASLDGRRDTQEYRLTRTVDGHTEALDLRIDTTPFEHGGEHFSLFAIQDISHQKRRSALEHIFFHDILNLAGGVKSFAQLLTEDPQAEDAPEMLRLVDSAASQVVDEINAQRILLAAENRELKVASSTLSAQAMVAQAVELYRRHPAATDKKIVTAAGKDDIWFHSDAALLGRVLGNMLKNALEAGRADDVITMGCSESDEGVAFWVHNPGFIRREVQLQLFQRSFSTKGAGRGLGTYSMRLLTEDFLQGRIDFISTPEEGTTFRATYPHDLAMGPAA